MLLPAPRQVTLTGDRCSLAPGKLILLDGPDPQVLLFSGLQFQHRLQACSSFTWEVAAGSAVPADQVGLHLQITSTPALHPQGYRLSIRSGGIHLQAASPAGIFYGICTLNQLVDQYGVELPTLEIEDFPDFPVRGALLDISRNKVPRLEHLERFVDLLASWKINQLQLYTENTFAYRRHPQVWQSASPMTGQDILELDRFCQERQVELVPNQNSFAHMERWLCHPDYIHLAETTGSFSTPWGSTPTGPYSLCPVDPGSHALIASLLDELLPHFSSRMVNIGCDETFDVGTGRSRQACAERGFARVYLDFLLGLVAEARRHGRGVQFWADMVLRYPEIIDDLPKDLLALVWGYEADSPLMERCALLQKAGLAFYVCPGTSSWLSVAGRTDNALANLKQAARAGLQHGAGGYLVPDWGDLGHWQPYPVHLLGFAAGAANAWCLETAQQIPLDEALSRHAFGDATGEMGRLAYRLGNAYRLTGKPMTGMSPLFWILTNPLESIARDPDLAQSDPAPVLVDLAECRRQLGQARPARWDAELLVREWDLTIRLLEHACHRWRLACRGETASETLQQTLARDLARDLDEIQAEFESIWRERNRPGGLADSLDRLRQVGEAYAA